MTFRIASCTAAGGPTPSSPESRACVTGGSGARTIHTAGPPAPERRDRDGHPCPPGGACRRHPRAILARHRVLVAEGSGAGERPVREGGPPARGDGLAPARG